jgi:hypothetical protein
VQNGKDFIGVKVGDLDNTAIANDNMVSNEPVTGIFAFDLKNRKVLVGEEVVVTFENNEAVSGYQLTLNYDGLSVLEVIGGPGLGKDNFGIFNTKKKLTVSADHTPGGFTIVFRALRNGDLKEMMQVSSDITKAEAYSKDENLSRLAVGMRFDGQLTTPANATTDKFVLYQNVPNPFVTKTTIGFNLPEAERGTLFIHDELGRLVHSVKGDFAKGYNAITLDKKMVNETGLLFYTLETAKHKATLKMISSLD